MKDGFICDKDWRFIADRIDMSGPCWEWTGWRHERGYGQFEIRHHYKRQLCRAHRVAYEIAYGTPVGDLCVCHHCDNPSCCNPDHLFLGTHDDNMRDMAEKGRARNGGVGGGPKGELCWCSKLTEKDVIFIRENYSPRHKEFGARPMARKFGVSHAIISKVHLGKIWTDVRAN